MTLVVKHAFNCGIPDDPIAQALGEILPSHFNADHSLSGVADITQGGTGAATKAAGFDALSPTTTRGDIIVRGPASNIRLGLGAAGYHIQSDGTDAVWSGFLQIGTGAVARTWNSKASDSLHIRDFGGVGDGATVNADAIWTNFINAIVSTGLPGEVSGGNYVFATASASVTPTGSFHLFGDGTVTRTSEVYAPLIEVVSGASPIIGDGLTFNYTGPNPQRTITGVTINGTTSVTYSYTGSAFTNGQSVTTFGIIGMGAGDTNGNLTGTITALGAGTFTIGVNGSTWSAYVSGGIAYDANAGNHQAVRIKTSTNGKIRGGNFLGSWYVGAELRDPTGGAIESNYIFGSINRGAYVQGANLIESVAVRNNYIDGNSVTIYGINTNIAAAKPEANVSIVGNIVRRTLSQGIGASGPSGAVINDNDINAVSGANGVGVLLEPGNVTVLPQRNSISGNVIRSAQICIDCNDDFYTTISGNNVLASIPAAVGSTPSTCIALRIQGTQEGSQSNNILAAVANTVHTALGAYFGVGTSGQNSVANSGSRNKIIVAGTGTLNGIQAIAGSNTTEWLMTKVEGATGFVVSDAGAGNLFSTGLTGTGDMVLATSPALLGTPTAPTAAIGTNTTQIATTAFAMGASGTLYTKLAGVSFAASADVPIPIVLPAWATRFAVFRLNISHASANLSTATQGVFPTTGAGGVAMVPTQANTITATADATAANFMSVNGAQVSYVAASLSTPNTAYLHITATAAGTADVVLEYFPLP